MLSPPLRISRTKASAAPHAWWPQGKSSSEGVGARLACCRYIWRCISPLQALEVAPTGGPLERGTTGVGAPDAHGGALIARRAPLQIVKRSPAAVTGYSSSMASDLG